MREQFCKPVRTALVDDVDALKSRIAGLTKRIGDLTGEVKLLKARISGQRKAIRSKDKIIDTLQAVISNIDKSVPTSEVIGCCKHRLADEFGNAYCSHPMSDEGGDCVDEFGLKCKRREAL